MNTPYKIANKKKAQVEFGYSGGKWTFRVGRYSIILHSRLGKEKATRIGEALRASWIRTEKREVKNDSQRVDGIARNLINRLTGQRTLADYDGEPQWWSSQSTPETPSVNMVHINQGEKIS